MKAKRISRKEEKMQKDAQQIYELMEGFIQEHNIKPEDVFHSPYMRIFEDMKDDGLFKMAREVKNGY